MLNATGSFLGGKVKKMLYKVLKYMDSPAEERVLGRLPGGVSGTGMGLGSPRPLEVSCITVHSSH